MISRHLPHAANDGRHVGIWLRQEVQRKMLAVAKGNVVGHEEVKIGILILEPVLSLNKQLRKHSAKPIAIWADAPQGRDPSHFHDFV